MFFVKYVLCLVCHQVLALRLGTRRLLNFSLLTSKRNNGWQKFRKFKLNYTSSLEAGSRGEDERFIIKPESWKAKTNHHPPCHFPSLPEAGWIPKRIGRHLLAWRADCWGVWETANWWRIKRFLWSSSLEIFQRGNAWRHEYAVITVINSRMGSNQQKIGH